MEGEEVGRGCESSESGEGEEGGKKNELYVNESERVTSMSH